VIAKDRHDRQPNLGKQSPRGDRLGYAPVLGDVPGDDEQIGPPRQPLKQSGHLTVLSLSHVQIADRG
jgi:hypothetical protein